MVVLILAALTAQVAQPQPARTSARAMVRILTPARASARDWDVAGRRTERIVIDEQGRSVRLRTIDFE